MIPLSRAFFVSLLRYTACASIALVNPAIAQTPPSGCDMGELATLPLKWTDDMRPISEAVINGRLVPVMVSTAEAEAVVLNKKTLNKLGIAVRSSTSTMAPEDARNPTGNYLVREVSYAMLDDFSFGTAKKKDVTYRVQDFMDDTFGVRIGAGTLLQTDIEIALDAGYIKLFKPKGCFRDHLAYWDPQAISVLSTWDVLKRDPRILFNVQVGGKTVSALLSTATPHSYMPRAAAERLGLSASSPGATREDPLPGHGPEQPVWKVPVSSISIGALEVKDFDLRLMDLPHSGEIMVLGADFLHRYRVYVAMSQNQVYLSPIRVPRAVRRGSVEVIGTPAQRNEQ